MKPLVSIAGGEGPYNNILKSISRLDLSGLKGKKVLIKPNCGRIAQEGAGITTHPQAVAELKRIIRLTLAEGQVAGFRTGAAAKAPAAR